MDESSPCVFVWGVVRILQCVFFCDPMLTYLFSIYASGRESKQVVYSAIENLA